MLVAESGELPGDANTIVALTFRHALTAVKFACGSGVKAGIDVESTAYIGKILYEGIIFLCALSFPFKSVWVKPIPDTTKNTRKNDTTLRILYKSIL